MNCEADGAFSQYYKIILSKKLGSGAFGDIYLGIKQKTGEEVAMKIVEIFS